MSIPQKGTDMTRNLLVLAIAAAGTAGCTSGYRVHVNTFTELGEPLGKTASIYVARDPNSRNPILGDQMAAKATRLLQDYGYNPVATAQTADYTLTFRAGVQSDRVTDYTPVYRPFGGFYGGYFGGWRGGYTTYMPYIETVHTHWLEMRLFPRDETGKERAGPVWMGEAVVGRDDPELREAINYLLIGCIEYLGVDTTKWVTMTIKRDDPRVLSLAEVR